jgi:hypothetical protein
VGALRRRDLAYLESPDKNSFDHIALLGGGMIL